MPADPHATDELTLLADEAAGFVNTRTGPPAVERRDVPVGDRSVLRARAWGQDLAERARLHRTDLSARTWDATAPVAPAAAIPAFAGA